MIEMSLYIKIYKLIMCQQYLCNCCYLSCCKFKGLSGILCGCFGWVCCPSPDITIPPKCFIGE